MPLEDSFELVNNLNVPLTASERKSTELKSSKYSEGSCQYDLNPTNRTDLENGDCTPITHPKNNSQTRYQGNDVLPGNLIKNREENDCINKEVQNLNLNYLQRQDELNKIKNSVLKNKSEDKVEDDSDGVKQVNKSLRTKVSKLKSENSTLKYENNSLREKLEAQKQIVPVQNKLNQTVTIIEKYERERQNFQTKIEEYEKAIIFKNNEILKLKLNCDNMNGLESKLNDDREILEKLHADNIELQSLNDQNMAKFIKALKDRDELQKNLKGENDQLRKRILELDSEYKNQMMEFSTNNGTYKTEMALKEEELCKMRNDIKQLSNDLKNKEFDYMEIIEDLQNKIFNLNEKNKELQKTIMENSTNNETYKTEMALKEEELYKLRNDNKQLSYELKNKQNNFMEKIDGLENKIFKLNEENKQLQKTGSKISGNNESMKKEMNIKQKEICKLSIKNEQLSFSFKEKLNNLEKELCKLRIKNKQFSVSLEEKKNSYMRNIKSLGNDILKLSTEKEELQNRESENLTNAESLKIELRLKEKELDELHKKNKQLSDDIHKQQNSSNENVKQFENDILKLKANNDQLKNANLQQQKDIEILRENLTSKEKFLKDILSSNRQLKDDTEKLEKNVLDLKERLVLMENALDEANDKIIPLEELKNVYIDKNNCLRNELAENESFIKQLLDENVELKRDLSEKTADAENSKEMLYIVRDEIKFKQNIIEQLSSELSKK